MNIDRIIKRKIRESKKFKKNSKVSVCYIKTKLAKHTLQVINKINQKYNLNISIEKQECEYVEDLLEHLQRYRDCIIIAPAEIPVTSFIITLADISNNYKYLIYEKTQSFFNITYEVSEFWFAKEYKKNLFREFKDIENFVLSIIREKEKFVRGAIKTIRELSEFFG